MNEQVYKIRAHHGMCLYYFRGKGYSDDFVRNMTDKKRELMKNPMVCITDQADIICALCPNNADGICTAEEKVAEYDRQVMMRCNLSEGDCIPFLDFEHLVQQNILFCDKRKEICGDCQWDSLCNDNHLDK